MTDEMTWINQARQGDDEAFTNLVETYQKPVYNLCYRMLGEAEAAEDAAQETFLKVYQNLARYDRTRSFATWLLSIAAHHCIDRLRRRRFPSVSIDENEEGQTDLPDRSAPDPEIRDRQTTGTRTPADLSAIPRTHRSCRRRYALLAGLFGSGDRPGPQPDRPGSEKPFAPGSAGTGRPVGRKTGACAHRKEALWITGLLKTGSWTTSPLQLIRNVS